MSTNNNHLGDYLFAETKQNKTKKRWLIFSLGLYSRPWHRAAMKGAAQINPQQLPLRYAARASRTPTWLPGCLSFRNAINKSKRWYVYGIISVEPFSVYNDVRLWDASLHEHRRTGRVVYTRAEVWRRCVSFKHDVTPLWNAIRWPDIYPRGWFNTSERRPQREPLRFHEAQSL